MTSFSPIQWHPPFSTPSSAFQHESQALWYTASKVMCTWVKPCFSFLIKAVFDLKGETVLLFLPVNEKYRQSLIGPISGALSQWIN